MRSPGLLAAIAATVTTAGIALLGASTVRLAGPKTKRSAEGPSPSYRAELIAPGVLSTPADEYGAAFSPDGRTVCFTRRSPTTTTRPFLVLLVSHLRAGRWSEPEVPPFSGLTNDFAPSFSPDGRRLFFTSDRPAPGRTHAAPGTIGAVGAADGFPDFDLWVVERQGEGWGEPRNLGAPINTEALEQHASQAADGTLYFSSSRAGGKGSLDLYRARWRGDRWAEPENLAEINTPGYESHPAIAADGSLLVFAATDRPDGYLGGGFPYSRGDLYVSFRTPAGGFTPARHLGPAINSTASESNPSLSPDGRWLYFTSERSFAEVPVARPLTAASYAAARASLLSGSGNLYRIDARAVRALAPEALAAAGSPPYALAPYALAAPLPHPRIFAPGVVSTREDEFGGAFEADGRTVWFDRTVPRSQLYTIFFSRFANGAWGAPQVAPFSGRYRDSDPVFTPDGDRLFFVSDRPRDGRPVRDFDIWVVERSPQGWGEPHLLPAPVNSEGSEYFVSATREGTLYFTSNRPGSKGGIDVWRSPWRGDRYGAPENLGEAINGPGLVNIEAYVAPDESFLLLGSFGRPDGPGDSDLFVSYPAGPAGPEGHPGEAWSKPIPLGPEINTAAREYSPRLSPDGRYLFYSSEKGLPLEMRRQPWTYRELESALQRIDNGLGNIYQVDLAAALPPRPVRPAP